MKFSDIKSKWYLPLVPLFIGVYAFVRVVDTTGLSGEWLGGVRTVTAEKSESTESLSYFELQHVPYSNAERVIPIIHKRKLTTGLRSPVRLSSTFQEAYLEFNVTNHGPSPLVDIKIDDVVVVRSRLPPQSGVSSTVFDISKHLSLLNRRTADVAISVFGIAAADVSLTLKLYKYKEKPSADIFNSDKSASRVTKLALDRWSCRLPQLPQNTTVAQLNLVVNEQEALHFKRNNPVRYLYVFVDDLYVGTVNVKPTLGNADYVTPSARDLFAPIVAHTHFTGFLYKVDLIPFLPLFWQGSHTLSIRMAAPFEKVPMEVTRKVSSRHGHVDRNWLISASILSWEIPGVISSQGRIDSASSSETLSAVANRKSLESTVTHDALVEAEFSSVLEYKTTSKTLRFRLLSQQRCNVSLSSRVRPIIVPYSGTTKFNVVHTFERNECIRDTSIVDDDAKTVAHQEYWYTKFPMKLTEDKSQNGVVEAFVLELQDDVVGNGLTLRTNERVESIKSRAEFEFQQNGIRMKRSVVDGVIEHLTK